MSDPELTKLMVTIIEWVIALFFGFPIALLVVSILMIITGFNN